MRLPGWFRVLTVLVLLAVCGTTVWYAVSVQTLDAQRQDLLIKLETSRGRERKQQQEYAQVAQALPEAQAKLSEAQPLTDEAVARQTELRAARKDLRNQKKQLQETLARLNEVNQQLEASVSLILQLQAIMQQDTLN